MSYCLLQSSSGDILCRGGPDEDFIFKDFPTGPLNGKNHFGLTTFDDEEIAYDYRVIEVSGYVKWKHQKSRGSGAKLNLARFSNETGKILGELELAEYVHEPDADGFSKAKFRFDRNDAQATSSYPFWNPGAAGMVWCKQLRAVLVCLWIILTHTMTQASLCNCRILSAIKQANLSCASWRFT